MHTLAQGAANSVKVQLEVFLAFQIGWTLLQLVNSVLLAIKSNLGRYINKQTLFARTGIKP